MARQDSLSNLFRALSHPYRRVVLYYLRDRGEASLDALAECVAGWMDSGPATGPDDDAGDDEMVRVQLHHAHLPMLAEAGFVTYDADSGEVTLGDLPPSGESVLSTAAAADAGDSELDVDALVASSGQ